MGVEALPELQLNILTESAKYLRSGGILTYSTCTLLPSENGEVIDKFLEANPEFEPIDFTAAGFASEGGRLTLVPSRHGCDGFFVARIRRK